MIVLFCILRYLYDLIFLLLVNEYGVEKGIIFFNVGVLFLEIFGIVKVLFINYVWILVYFL